MTMAGMEAGAATTATVAPSAAERLAPWQARALEQLQTRVGRLLMVGVFAALMLLLRMPHWWQAGIVLALISAFPAQRRWLMTAAALWWVFLVPPVSLALLNQYAPKYAAERWINYWPVGVVGAWAIACGYLALVRRFPKSPVGRRPIIALVLLYTVMLVVMSQAPLRGAAWFFTMTVTFTFGSYLWFFAYTVAENLHSKKNVSLTEAGNWRPFWGFTSVPLGKGWAHLSRIEAKTDEQFAKVQLRGLKLMLRAIVLTALLMAGHKLLYRTGPSLTKMPEIGTQLTDYLVPTYDMALSAMQAGEPYSLPMRWAALLTYFALRVTALVVFGHKVIAILRMAGYDAFRNTYRPFESTTIAEFYNRIYYYFKELLVVFFFYPTYLRYFKKHPRVRLFMATLAAAGLGNFLFHFLRDSEHVLELGPLGALWFYRSYAAYALILGCAIAWSQLRVVSKKSPPLFGWRKYRAIAFVLIFYTFICIVEEPNDKRGLGDYATFFISLFRP